MLFYILSRVAQHVMNNFIFHANTEFSCVEKHKAIFFSDCPFYWILISHHWVDSSLTINPTDLQDFPETSLAILGQFRGVPPATVSHLM